MNIAVAMTADVGKQDREWLFMVRSPVVGRTRVVEFGYDGRDVLPVSAS